jgi:hypothetical protein
MDNTIFNASSNAYLNAMLADNPYAYKTPKLIMSEKTHKHLLNAANDAQITWMLNNVLTHPPLVEEEEPALWDQI